MKKKLTSGVKIMKNSGVKIMKKKITFSILFIFAMIMSTTFAGNVSAQATAPSLGTAASFAVLGGSTVTNTGASVVTGDLGVSPGSAVTGFPPGIVLGTIHTNDAVASQAQSDATVAYNNLAGRACNTNLTGQDLGGLTLTTGVYCFNTSAQLTGTLTLDAQGDPNAVFIFQIGSTLTTTSNSSVVLINGAAACNVFFQVGSSATLGTDTSFQGNILAFTSITLNTRASLNGRAFALNGAVTLDTNSITNCMMAPTAAPASISGRVISPFGRGIARARIFLTNSMGEKRIAVTNPFGYFSFEEISSGENYVVEITHKSYIFTPQVLLVTNDLTGLNFTGLPYGKSGGKSKFIPVN